MKISRELVGGLSHLGRRKKDHAATMTRTPTRRRTGTKGTLTKKICQECGKAEDASKHIRYSNDLDNPVKHAFVPEVEIPKMGSLWWVARDLRNDSTFGYYCICRVKPRNVDGVGWTPIKRAVEPDLWHFLGLPRLLPGAGPVRIRILERWWERV